MIVWNSKRDEDEIFREDENSSTRGAPLHVLLDATAPEPRLGARDAKTNREAKLKDEMMRASLEDRVRRRDKLVEAERAKLVGAK